VVGYIPRLYTGKWSRMSVLTKLYFVVLSLKIDYLSAFSVKPFTESRISYLTFQ